jgi:hypothetical protein
MGAVQWQTSRMTHPVRLRRNPVIWLRSKRGDEEERRQRVMVITEFDAGDPPKEHAEFVAGTFIGAYTETPKNLVGFFAPTHSR